MSISQMIENSKSYNPKRSFRQRLNFANIKAVKKNAETFPYGKLRALLKK